MKTYIIVAVWSVLAGCSIKQPFSLREPSALSKDRGTVFGLRAADDGGVTTDAGDAAAAPMEVANPAMLDGVDAGIEMPPPAEADMGAAGATGGTGAIGPLGAAGADGSADATGFVGTEGSAGATGATGATGSVGEAAGDAQGTDDAGTPPDAGGNEMPNTSRPTVTTGESGDGSLRSITVRLTGMEDDLHHFAQFRLSNEAHEFRVMFVIHEGLTSGDYTFTLPNALFAEESYHLDFFIDHDETTGPGFYDEPPVDHAWSIEIPAGEGDVDIDFPYNEMFTDIESIAPTPFHSTVLSVSGMGAYASRLIDVRLIDHRNGRLVGRQVREVPGDSFDVTVGSTTEEGVMYDVAVAVDQNGDGEFNDAADPSWRVTGTADENGLHPRLPAGDK